MCDAEDSQKNEFFVLVKLQFNGNEGRQQVYTSGNYSLEPSLSTEPTSTVKTREVQLSFNWLLPLIINSLNHVTKCTRLSSKPFARTWESDEVNSVCVKNGNIW